MEQVKDTTTIKKLSLRDPAGSLFDINGRLIRIVNKDSLNHFTASLESPTFVAFQDSGRLAGTKILPQEKNTEVLKKLADLGVDLETIGKLIEHDRVDFISFPYEWSPSMLYAAAELSLELAEKLLPEGMGIKDATPYNVLFNGPKPIFVDVLSIEKRIRGDATWIPFAQFTRTFLNPLLLNKYFGISLPMSLLSRREGVDLQEVYKLCPFWKRFKHPFFSLITVPYLLNRLSKKTTQKRSEELLAPEKARFILSALLKHLRKILLTLNPQSLKTKSRWRSYMKETLPYTKEQFSEKEEWIDQVIKQIKPQRVLDIGCNTGHFSILAAQRGATVVAIDSDSVVVDEVWQQAKKNNLPILPLNINVASPSPAVGWKNAETESFLKRARGYSDLVLALAVIHHLTLDEGLPLTEVLALFSELTKEYIIVEFVGSEDVSVKDLIKFRRPKEVITESVFENKANFLFDIIARKKISQSDRTLYLLKKKSGNQDNYQT